MHRIATGFRGYIMALLAASGLGSSCGSSIPVMAALPAKPKPQASKGQFVGYAPPTQQMVDGESERQRRRSAGHGQSRSCYMRKRLYNRKMIRAIGRAMSTER